MGELAAGTPALRLETLVSAPLNLVSVLSLLYRAGLRDDLDPWLTDARRTLPPNVVDDLDLLHGFSGRLLYYMEEPVMCFDPLRPEHREMDIEDLLRFLDALPAVEFRSMAANALHRVHQDLAQMMPILADDDHAWRTALAPALTTAPADEVMDLLNHPERLKDRTIGVIRAVGDGGLTDEYGTRLAEMRRATAIADRRAGLGGPAANRDVELAFARITGHRLPEAVEANMASLQRVVFCPSAHVGPRLVSFIVYPPALIVFFDTAGLLGQFVTVPTGDSTNGAGEDVLEALRALADPTRLRILNLLASERLYAQEIVARLDIPQSAVSRHLSQLERAGLLVVQRSRGAKYYEVVSDRLDQISVALRALGHHRGTSDALTFESNERQLSV